MPELLSKTEGEVLLLLGNDAVARGAIEAGLGFASCYPGTPSSEVSNQLYALQEAGGFYMEFAINEKVALEAAGGAALAGVRSLTAMKHVGLNVAADPLMTLAYVGVRAGLVIYDADDPGMFSSQNEQDNRYLARLAGLPLLEPRDSQEMKDMTAEAFALSEQLGLPVMVRSTTRLAHGRGPVKLGALAPASPRGHFTKSPRELVALPANTPAMHRRLLAKQETARRLSEHSPHNRSTGRGELGIITSGMAANYALDAIADLGLADRVAVLNLGFTHPLPKEKIVAFLEGKTRVLVIEELEPYLEEAVKALAQAAGQTLPVLGKGFAGLSRCLEYDPLSVRAAVAQLAGVAAPLPGPLDLAGLPELPKRPPNLCPGCPHRMTYYAVKRAAGPEAVFPNDIGCYTLGFFPPFGAADLGLCMGASVSASAGMSRVSGQRVVAFIGDSTFFHSGLTGLAHAVFNNHKFTLVILDNGITAMTGHQPSAAMNPALADHHQTPIDLEAVVRALGVKFVKVVRPTNLAKTEKEVAEALAYDGLAVLISREPCPLHAGRKKENKRPRFTVDQSRCRRHRVCVEQFACPAFYLAGEEVRIAPDMCIGCAACVQVCPEGAIRPLRATEGE